jgi:hypothetical protein
VPLDTAGYVVLAFCSYSHEFVLTLTRCSYRESINTQQRIGFDVQEDLLVMRS